MLSPAPGRPLTSPFGPRISPITGEYVLHAGVDFGGTFPVLAAASGTILDYGYSAVYGHWVLIEHSATLRTFYAHGAAATGWQRGDAIDAGAVVFTSGSTGWSTGDHVHFEVRVLRGGVWTPVDPEPYLNPTTITLGALMNNWSIVLHKSGRNQAFYLIGEGRIKPISQSAVKELGLKRRTVGDAGMAAIREQLNG